MCWSSGMASSPMRLASCPSRSLSLVCRILTPSVTYVLHRCRYATLDRILSRRHDSTRWAHLAVLDRVCLPPLGSSGYACHASVSSTRNRQPEKVVQNLPQFPEPHHSPTRGAGDHLCRQRPTWHPAAWTKRAVY